MSATLWLAKTVAKVGRTLKAGDFVLTGGSRPDGHGQARMIYETRVSGLGSVRAAFAKE